MGGAALNTFRLPFSLRQDINRLPSKLLLELSHDADGLAEYLRVNEPKLLPDQRLVYETVIRAIEKQAGSVFFLDAPGGTGKSFVTQLILAEIRREKQIALAVASSGIAATLLPGGRTAHSAFKLPLDLVRAEVPTCNIGKNSEEAEVLRQYHLIVWDECTMTNKGAFEPLDRSLKGIKDSTASMGDVTLLLSGDFRQTLPVIPKGSRADEVRACLKSSTLWPQVKTLSQSTNMRAHLLGDSTSAAFAEDILALGEGKVPRNDRGDISISELCNTVDNPSDLLETVFPNLESNYADINWLSERTILAPQNVAVSAINDQLISAIPGEERIYKSIDRTSDPHQTLSITLSSFLTHWSQQGFHITFLG
ncbi:ATP-dependent DNA helicase pif1 [Octopus bimaculoides]|uniref:ATP-dependent DNA helicase pif1 n=1 Tax=Octopus bimaculoides TaxID=37653 RepID=UPI00071C6311|nr:ATP-dependent DNA helicase pif1 [Octopus bimaculoides]|eukprot:XP_014776932.1 PREDICTED: ATP-dependent DNA helicase pif1-like [Octopus bimaculoides]